MAKQWTFFVFKIEKKPNAMEKNHKYVNFKRKS